MRFSGVEEIGKAKLRTGRAQLERVRLLLPLTGPTDALHEELRESMTTLRSAMNWLEDTPRFDVAHGLLDEAGKLARERFPVGCGFPFEEGSYYVRCPVALAHNRVGFSIGVIVEESHCSICKQDPHDCPHITGFEYDGEVCVHVITGGRITDVSLVGRPNIPDARIESMSIEIGRFVEAFGSDFVPGTPVVCDRCLQACDGVARPYEDTGH